MYVCIGIGTNVGDRARNVRFALECIAKLPETSVVKCSNIYETPPVGPVDQGAYLNAAAKLQTSLDLIELRRKLADIERAAGREPAEKRIHWGPRVLDLDVLLAGQTVLDDPELVVPHPRMHERWFALKPLADVAADWIHPKLNEAVADLLSDVADQEPDDFVVLPSPHTDPKSAES